VNATKLPVQQSASFVPASAPQPEQAMGGARVMSRRRYVARGVPGGYRVWDDKRARWRGDLCELCPDGPLVKLNGAAPSDKTTMLMQRYRAMKR
jgi:hypothetical protein